VCMCVRHGLVRIEHRGLLSASAFFGSRFNFVHGIVNVLHLLFEN